MVISDDGLQHYALQRSVEIVLVDGQRGFGNQHLLPCGPLRESLSRLDSIDYLISNGNKAALNVSCDHFEMQLQPLAFHSLSQADDLISANDWPHSKRVHALAGIGNPQRFYSSLRSLGFDPVEHDFPDHHNFCPEDLQFGDDLPVIMTEKDAVKVRALKLADGYWFLAVAAQVEASGIDTIIAGLKQ